MPKRKNQRDSCSAEAGKKFDSNGSCSRNAAAKSVSPPTRHDVFLSFRGEDTREGFTSHLHAALCRKHVETYIDYRLVRGEEISPALERAIEESTIYVVIFSQHYASSTWCLNELTKILGCKKRFGREVIPVFYNVDPSDVRNQKESYAEAFVKHELCSMDKVRDWKASLTQAAGLSGWDSRVIRNESKLVEAIVKDILIKLESSSISDNEGLIGIHKHIEQIESRLNVESAAVGVIGIWGMAGIGKTTIAKTIYRKLATQFTSGCFVENVQGEIERDGGIYNVRQKFLSKLLDEESGGCWQRLQRVKVLLVLDNVNTAVQLKDLIGRQCSYGLGSRIIVTSRDKQALNNVAEERDIYEVKEMNFQDSLQLFSLNAFEQNHPKETYMGLSEKILNYAKGIPLALKVLGSLLRGRTREAWESGLQKLEKPPNLKGDTFKVLKLSYDGLDEEQQDIFLDIACFYRGHEEKTLKQTLDACGFSAAIGMQVLIDRCLISILNRKIVMHDLVQDMGQEIVRGQSGNPGKRSRLWKHEDIYQVLAKNKGTDAIQCIFLDMCKGREVQLHAETLKMMDKLRLLQFYKSNARESSKAHILESLQSLPHEMRFLHWDDFPQRSLPPDFCPGNLVELNMRDSHLERLWDGDQDLPNLKKFDLSGSRKLTQIPDLSHTPNIEEIVLSHCIKLDEVYSSNDLRKLKCLWLNGCDALRRLKHRSSILRKSKGVIVFCNCRSLEQFEVDSITLEPRRAVYFPDVPEMYEEPSDTKDLLNIMLREGSPSSFPSLNELCWLDLSNCESLRFLKVAVCRMRHLRRLNLSGCSNLEDFPAIGEYEFAKNLTVLMLDGTAVRELPSTLDHLVAREELSLQRCQRLELIPSSIGSLSKLRRLDLTNCESLATLPSSIFKLKLSKLDLHGCSMLRTLPEIIEPAESIAHLCLTKTAIKELPSSLDYLVGLQTLRLTLCRDLEFIPNSIVNLKLLSVLDCSGCAKLREIPNDIGCWPSLSELSLQGSGIVNLPESIAHLSSLKSLDLSDCEMLECIPELPPFLKQVLAFDCPSVRKVSSSRLILSSDSKEGIFKFHFTNSQELDPSAHGNIAADALRRILRDGYRSVFLSFPGSTVLDWFPYRCKGHSVTISARTLDWCNDARFIGFALCVVVGGLEGENEMAVRNFHCRFRFESDDGLHIIPIHNQLEYYCDWKGKRRFVSQNHTLVWKYCLLESASIKSMLSHAHSFTFEIVEEVVSGTKQPYFIPASRIKECGICPLYTQEKGDGSRPGDCLVHHKVRQPDF